MGSLPIAILGIAIAVTMFFGEKRTIDLKNSLKETKTVSNDEEDFF